MSQNLKKSETIGCCGIDCGLCPRYHSTSDSACPGCGGANFKEKHPSCGFLSCCAIKQGFEVCSECNLYPCKRFEAEKSGFDSFVTHKKVFENLNVIQKDGLGGFLNLQKLRMDLLSRFIENFDDGRSKSYFCLACTLLPLNYLQRIYKEASENSETLGLKEKNRMLRERLNQIASSMHLELKLNKK